MCAEHQGFFFSLMDSVLLNSSENLRDPPKPHVFFKPMTDEMTLPFPESDLGACLLIISLLALWKPLLAPSGLYPCSLIVCFAV